MRYTHEVQDVVEGARSMAKKMGNNPLTGLNGLIRNTQEMNAQGVQATLLTSATQTAHDAPSTLFPQNTHITPDTQQVHDVPAEYATYNEQQLHDTRDAFAAYATHDILAAHNTHDDSNPLAAVLPKENKLTGTQGKKGQKLPRINMAFTPEHLYYLHAIAGFERISATQYVNNLIQKDMEQRKELYETLNALRGTVN